METGSVVEWLKRPGEFVRQGEQLMVIQSDKAANEIEALESGYLDIPETAPAIGAEVPIGTLLAYLLTESEARERGVTIAGGNAPSSAAGATLGSLVTDGAPRGLGAVDAPEMASPIASPTLMPAATSATRVAVRDDVALLRAMLRIRKVEEALARSHQQGLVHGACHTYVGEEAIAAAVCAHLDDRDTIWSTHRGHGHALAKGVAPREIAAELFGRATGCAGGRGGSMHLFKPEVGLMGTSGIVGPCILLATGAGYTSSLLGDGRVSVAFFGDGASNNGAFHEGINLATIWNLPVIFVCENNQYATEVPFASVSKQPDVSKRAVGYGLPGVTVDGNNVRAVWEVAREAVDRARAGLGPTLIEAKTYRTRAHSEGMRDAGYRSVEEIDAWKGLCPIRHLRAMLEREGHNPASLDAIEAEMDAEARDAIAFATESPWPDGRTAADHVVGWVAGTPLAGGTR
jgi:TPP-dependent pyruvate/acetoin dehydrogenase alpha subunit